MTMMWRTLKLTLISVLLLSYVIRSESDAHEADAMSMAAFQQSDKDGNGYIDKSEMSGLLHAAGIAKFLVESLGIRRLSRASRVVRDDTIGTDDRTQGDAQGEYGGSFMQAFLNSLLMIIVTELGDKTFFIAAIMAMRSSRIAVFVGAFGALIVMTVLSAVMGLTLPNLIPRKYTHYLSAALFLFFGLQLLRDASKMEGSGPSEELAEVEEQLIAKKNQGGNGDVENGEAVTITVTSDIIKLATQAFSLTFLAEWGDRSQIATIAMAAAKNPYGVTIGAVFGHGLCTGLAVVGGRMLASRISEKTVAITGGVLFLGFALHSLLFPEL